jgi:hypothetical protein
MDLTIYFEKIVRNFTRYHKYTLGSELRKKSREIVGLIIKANSTVEKLPGEENWDRQLFRLRSKPLRSSFENLRTNGGVNKIMEDFSVHAETCMMDV